jgi:hypothetical protein
VKGSIVTKKKAIKTEPQKIAPTHEEYVSFLRKVALQGVGLESASAKVDRTALSEAAASDQAGELSLDASFQVLLHAPDRLVTGGTFKVKQAPKELEVPLLEIECTFSAMFQLGEPIDQATAERFANAEAKLVFWPYLRHFIADTSYRMAINPILLPLMAVGGPPTANE